MKNVYTFAISKNWQWENIALTYDLTDERVVNLIDASSKHTKRKPRVKQEVQKSVPPISADADHTAIEKGS